MHHLMIYHSLYLEQQKKETVMILLSKKNESGPAPLITFCVQQVHQFGDVITQQGNVSV